MATSNSHLRQGWVYSCELTAGNGGKHGDGHCVKHDYIEEAMVKTQQVGKLNGHANSQPIMVVYHQHCIDITWASWRLKSPATWPFVPQLVQAYMKENIKDLNYRLFLRSEVKPTWWESTCFPHKWPVMRISMVWRHHSIHTDAMEVVEIDLQRRWSAHHTAHPQKYPHTPCFVVFCCCLAYDDFTYILQDYFGDTEGSLWLSQRPWSKPENHIVVLTLQRIYGQNLDYIENESCHQANFVVNGSIGGCHTNYLQCHQRWRS